MKKYGKTETHLPKSASTVSLPAKSKSEPNGIVKSTTNTMKNNLQGNTTKRQSIPVLKKVPSKVGNNSKNVPGYVNKVSNVDNTKKDKPSVSKINSKLPKAKSEPNNAEIDKPLKEITSEVNIKSINSDNPQITITEPAKDAKKAINNKFNSKPDLKSRKSTAVMSKTENRLKSFNSRKSVQPQKSSNKESVFERLYKPKVVQKESIDNVLKLKTDPSYLKKVINESRLIMNKRNTVFESKPNVPVRRSISAVHFKRISKQELGNCFHKWASIGETIDKVHLKDVNEDDCVREEKLVSAVKSERKKVKFQTPVPFNFNTPKPEELQARLVSWLKKQGKSIDSYHHLQCFGLHNLSREIRPLNLETEEFDDENKENIALEHDSDNDSYLENMNNKVDDLNDMNKLEFPKDNWRRVSSIIDSVDYNDSYETTLTSAEAVHHVDDLLLGALNDLTELLREVGYLKTILCFYFYYVLIILLPYF